jgi:glycosyltransferase involved in cell wall biosynthesis
MCAGIPPQIYAARQIRGTLDTDAAEVASCGCRMVVIHALEHQLETMRSLAERFPRVAFVAVFHGSQNVIARTPLWAGMQRDFLQLSEALPNVWYATPEPTVPWESLGYRRAVVWPNCMPIEPRSELPVIEPPMILLAGRQDLIKCYPVAVLAAGLVARVRPVRVATVIQARDAALDAIAETAGVTLEHHPWMTWDDFHRFIRSQVSVTVCPSLTDSFHYVSWDSLANGRPAVGSQTIRYLPAEWQADPNDPADVARIVCQILDDYDAASRQAYKIAEELGAKQRAAYLALYGRLVGSLS